MSDSFVTPWAVAYQASLSMGFPRQEYWDGLPFPSPGNLPDPGIKPVSPALQADSLPLSQGRVGGRIITLSSHRKSPSKNSPMPHLFLEVRELKSLNQEC